MRTCFCCDKELEQDHGDEPTGTCNYLDATCWRSYGNWTSQAFDGAVEPDFLQLELLICDECLKKKIDTLYGWENIRIMAEPMDLGEISPDLAGKKMPIIKEQKCGEFKKYHRPK
jgi:hypothetical protein